MDYREFHRNSSMLGYNFRRGLVNDFASWPAAWSRIETKEYGRSAELKLPPPEELPNTTLAEVLRTRRSRREGTATTGGRLELAEVSTVLHHSFGLSERFTGVDSGSRRAYPSAGARFPVELYVIGAGIDELDERLFHYAPLSHTLHLLPKTKDLASTLHGAFGEDWISSARGLFVLTAVMPRTWTKYKNRGYRYALLEAGHLAQNILLTCTALALSASVVGGFADQPLARLLGVDNEFELVLSTVVLP